MKKFINFINSKFILLVTGFLLTGIVGSYLNYQYQRTTWERETRCEAIQRQLDQIQKTMEEILLDMSSRFYAMQKVFWSLESFRHDEAIQRWKEYCVIKDNWNLKINNYRSKIKIFIDHDLAYQLLDKNDAREYEKKDSIHAAFVFAHYKLKKLLEYKEFDSQKRKNMELETLGELSELGKRISDFSDECYKVYVKKLNLFEREFK